MNDIKTDTTNIEISLVDSVTYENLGDIGTDAAELILDSVLSEGILQDIPIFGTLYKLGKTGFSLRDKYFAKKVVKFLFDIKDITADDRQKFITELEGTIGNPIERFSKEN